MIDDIAKLAHETPAACVVSLSKLILHCSAHDIGLVGNLSVFYPETVIDGTVVWTDESGNMFSTDSVGIFDRLDPDAEAVAARWVQLMVRDRKAPHEIVADYPDWFRP